MPSEFRKKYINFNFLTCICDVNKKKTDKQLKSKEDLKIIHINNDMIVYRGQLMLLWEHVDPAQKYCICTKHNLKETTRICHTINSFFKKTTFRE